MFPKKMTVLILSGLLLVSLAGCVTPQVRILYHGSDLPGSLTGTYAYFFGAEHDALDLEAGSTIELDYDVRVTYGELTLGITAPDGSELAHYRFTQAAKEKVLIPVSQDGIYNLTLEGKATGGKYAVAWSAQ